MNDLPLKISLGVLTFDEFLPIFIRMQQGERCDVDSNDFTRADFPSRHDLVLLLLVLLTSELKKKLVFTCISPFSSFINKDILIELIIVVVALLRRWLLLAFVVVAAASVLIDADVANEIANACLQCL